MDFASKINKQFRIPHIFSLAWDVRFQDGGFKPPLWQGVCSILILSPAYGPWLTNGYYKKI